MSASGLRRARLAHVPAPSGVRSNMPAVKSVWDAQIALDWAVHYSNLLANNPVEADPGRVDELIGAIECALELAHHVAHVPNLTLGPAHELVAAVSTSLGHARRIATASESPDAVYDPGDDKSDAVRAALSRAGAFAEEVVSDLALIGVSLTADLELRARPVQSRDPGPEPLAEHTSAGAHIRSVFTVRHYRESMCRQIVALATTVLPPDSRPRYHHEYRAELYDLRAQPRKQLAHALGIVSRCWVLRRSLTNATLPASTGTGTDR